MALYILRVVHQCPWHLVRVRVRVRVGVRVRVRARVRVRVSPWHRVSIGAEELYPFFTVYAAAWMVKGGAIGDDGGGERVQPRQGRGAQRARSADTGSGWASRAARRALRRRGSRGRALPRLQF